MLVKKKKNKLGKNPAGADMVLDVDLYLIIWNISDREDKNEGAFCPMNYFRLLALIFIKTKKCL